MQVIHPAAREMRNNKAAVENGRIICRKLFNTLINQADQWLRLSLRRCAEHLTAAPNHHKLPGKLDRQTCPYLQISPLSECLLIVNVCKLQSWGIPLKNCWEMQGKQKSWHGDKLIILGTPPRVLKRDRHLLKLEKHDQQNHFRRQ